MGDVGTLAMYVNSRRIQLARSWSKYWQGQIVLVFAITPTRNPLPPFSPEITHPTSPILYADDETTDLLRM